MMEFICYFLPGISSAVLAERLMHRDVSGRVFFSLIAVNTMLTNLIVMIIKIYIMDSPALQFSYDDSIRADSVVKYMVMAIAVGVLIGLAEGFYDKNFRIRMADKKQKEEGKEE